MTALATATQRVRKPAVLAGDWLLYQHPDIKKPTPRCCLCGGTVADQTRAMMLPGQEASPNQGPPLAHQGCVFKARRHVRCFLHVL